ncbi:MAG: hypothetical protein K0Q95_3075 [Bacteroidota bacterium]|jgi:hypothetical protein|nr:hypothetical protein [Bacteroidota bacterium]
MEIKINDRRKIFAVQEEFNTMFPYLRLDFFPRSVKNSGTTQKPLINGRKTLGECSSVQKRGMMTITPEMTVSDLEKSFNNIYGLEVVVQRKSGKVWLEVTVSESWTLEEQNRQGESLSKIAV